MLHNDQKNESILITGCGRFGAHLASLLSAKGYNVSIIDKDENAFHRLREDFQGFQIHGDACDLDTLEECGISKSSNVIVCTNNDSVNCMIAQIANIIYHIPNVYIRLSDPDKEEMLDGTSIKAIYPALLSIHEFERMSGITFKEGQHV